MFRVRHKATGDIHTVYAVTGVRFLIWVDLPHGEEHWTWVDMGDCVPLKEGE